MSMAAVNTNYSSSRKSSFASSSSIPRAVRSGDDVEDRRERLVRSRLRWLEGQWDGNIPRSKSPPRATGPQSTHGRHRVARKSSRRASQCGEEVVVTAVFKERPSEAADRTPGRRRQLNRPGKPKSVVSLTDSIYSAGGKKRDQNRFLTKENSHGGVGNEDGARALIDRRGVIAGDAENAAASSSEARRGCLAQSSSNKVNVPGLEVTRKPMLSYDGDGDGHRGGSSSRAEHHAIQGVASPRTMASDSDAVSELSTESFTLASVDDETGCTYFHQPSMEPPSALLMAPPFVGDDSAVNISQGGARRSEIERASPRWEPAETGAEVTDAARAPVVTATRKGQPHGSPYPNISAPGRVSFGRSSLPLSTAAPGFEFDSRSDSSCAAPSSWCTRPGRVKVLDMADTVNANEQILGLSSTGCLPLASSNAIDEDGRERSRRLLEEEIVSLKENLRRAEIRLAAAEATASSVLQRAQAAELSREVKEIQIRNLEIRLARYTSSDDDNHQRQESCARRRDRHRGGEIAGRSRWQEPLFDVERESSPCETNDLGHASAAATTSGNPATLNEPVVCEPRSSSTPNDFVDGADARTEWRGRLRKLEVNFRRNCVVLGARAARASEGAVAAVEAAAAAAANKTPKEATVLRAAAVEGGGQVQADNGSRAKTDRDVIDEYWGSDYCISV